VPADVLKFVLYESLRGSLPPPLAGAVATALSQLASTPLDVARVRVILGQAPAFLPPLSSNAAAEGAGGLWRGWQPRVGKALVSGAVQFAVYEGVLERLAPHA
jgi:hypothetical protein